MGIQKNQYYIGRQGHLVYYQWRDIYCVRTKGSLDRKRFFSDKAFEGSRKRAVEFGVAAKLAAEVYQLLPKELKKRGFIGRLTGWAHRGLMNGKSREEVQRELLISCGLNKPDKTSKNPVIACTSSYIQLQSPLNKNNYSTLSGQHLNRVGKQLHYQRLQNGRNEENRKPIPKDSSPIKANPN
jgi:hypothetical protein